MIRCPGTTPSALARPPDASSTARSVRRMVARTVDRGIGTSRRNQRWRRQDRGKWTCRHPRSWPRNMPRRSCSVNPRGGDQGHRKRKEVVRRTLTRPRWKEPAAVSRGWLFRRSIMARQSRPQGSGSWPKPEPPPRRCPCRQIPSRHRPRHPARPSGCNRSTRHSPTRSIR